MKRQHFITVLVALVFATVSQNVFSQYTVSGKITDKEDGKSLAGANVIVQGTRFSTSSSADGTYSIAGLKPGSYKFKVSFIGYKTIIQEIEVVIGKVC